MTEWQFFIDIHKHNRNSSHDILSFMFPCHERQIPFNYNLILMDAMCVWCGKCGTAWLAREFHFFLSLFWNFSLVSRLVFPLFPSKCFLPLLHRSYVVTFWILIPRMSEWNAARDDLERIINIPEPKLYCEPNHHDDFHYEQVTQRHNLVVGNRWEDT